MKNRFKFFLPIIFIIGLITFNAIPISIFNIDINKFSNTEYFLYLFVCDIVFLGLIVFAYFKTLKKDFKTFFKDFSKNFEFSFKCYLIGFAIMVISNFILIIITKGAIAGNEQAVRDYINKAPLFMLFEVAIYAPFTEELIFRKGIRDIFKNKWLFIIISGLLFGFMHVASSLNNPYGILYIIPYSSLGISFAYCYYKSNNIYSTITMHAIHNLLAIIIYFVGLS